MMDLGCGIGGDPRVHLVFWNGSTPILIEFERVSVGFWGGRKLWDGVAGVRKWRAEWGSVDVVDDRSLG